MDDMIHISLGNAGIAALLGYLVVFIGLVLLMLVVLLLGRLLAPKAKPTGPVAQAMTEPVPAASAPGTAGDIKLYDTDPRDAAMAMAIVANTLDKPLNQLRFISIREVKNDEI